LASADLVAALAKVENSPWGEWNHGRPITPIRLARLLKPFEITPRNLKQPGDKVLKGYWQADFREAWSLYLPKGPLRPPDRPPQKRYPATESINTDQNANFEPATESAGSVSENGVSANKDAGGSGVAFQSRPAGRRNELGIETNRIHFADDAEVEL
jgi:hypothetical protein